MLAHRIATALVLLVVLLAALWSRSVLPFAVLMAVMVLACAWEWGRLCGMGQVASLSLAGITAALLVATVLYAGLPSGDVMPSTADTVVRSTGSPVAAGAAALATARAAGWWVSGAAWLVGLVLVLRAGVAGWRDASRGLRLATGLAILVLAWWAMVLARAIGVNFLLSTLTLIFASDIGAYFGGKAWGGRVFGARKLAPSISPAKTWEGAASGLAGALALSVFWVLVVDRVVPVDGPSLQALLVVRWGWIAMFAAVALLTTAGIMGDLFESLVKRAAGAKDSSRLLPGHGGVLDRVDALLPVLPIAIALVV